MAWDKLGRVFDPKDVMDSEWWVSHAALPTPHVLDDRIRVYVAAWDAEKRGRIAFVDLDRNDPTEVIGVSEEPALDLGEPGTFDSHGVNPSSVLVWNDKLYLYYIGWQRLTDVRYTLFTGLARAPGGVEGRMFHRYSQAPLLDRKSGERYVRTAPVAKQIGHSIRLWYAAGDGWIDVGGKETPTYSLRAMDMPTPTQPPSTSVEVLPVESHEIGIGRPAVDFNDESRRWEMWYSSRTRDGYRVLYAEASQAGLFVPGSQFRRMYGPASSQASFVKPSDDGWDSEMVCFPALVDVDGRRYMLYNGNDYGRTGFGLAWWDG